MDKLAEKLNELPKLSDSDKESDLGYIFGVSGPGKLLSAPQSLCQYESVIFMVI